MSYDVGITVAVMASAALAQYAPNPLRTPYAMSMIVCVIVGVGVLLLREPHGARLSETIRIARPSVPQGIRADSWFSVLGAIATWSVLGVLLSLYPSLAAQQARVENLLFTGGIVAVTAFAAAMAQLSATRLPPRRQAVIGDVGMAVTLAVTVPVLHVHSPIFAFVASAFLGGTFGLAFGGSVRHRPRWYLPTSVVKPCRRST
jgi:hypothetical protein